MKKRKPLPPKKGLSGGWQTLGDYQKSHGVEHSSLEWVKREEQMRAQEPKSDSPKPDSKRIKWVDLRFCERITSPVVKQALRTKNMQITHARVVQNLLNLKIIDEAYAKELLEVDPRDLKGIVTELLSRQ